MKKRKEKRYIFLGEEFKEKKGIFDIKFLNDITYYKGLYQCYNRPSETKQAIFNKYKKMLEDNTDDFNFLYYGIKSFNANVITLHAIIRKDGKNYYLYITPSYNYYEEIEG